jgi:hypothetical protein
LILAARSLLPAGFMLQTSAAGDGTLSIVICSGHGPQAITLDSDGKPANPQPTKSDAGLCPYAASAAPVLCSEEPAAAGPIRHENVDYPPPVELALAGWRTGVNSARGPPDAAA